MQLLVRIIILICLPMLASAANAERVEVTLSDNTTLSVYLLFPEGAKTSSHPLMILMPGGSGEEALARDLQSWLGVDLAERGWVVAVPVSPNNSSFRGNNNRYIPLLIDTLQKDERIASGKVMLAGISNGGMSALEIATAAPQAYLGVMAIPALIPRGLDLAPLAGMPVYLRIGDQDEMGWQDRLEETAAALTSAGALVNADLVFMSPHMFFMEWETLDPWLQDIRAAMESE
ncbi:MAG: dienelactone hydrolase family protein [Gammaproteobacteria bacterium]|nr:dienelactone hydrolase family protein [Gammaproteobacteria bacterium]MDP2139413.1 dienelactone hydrolase family protein [Gammaproteobacteria bacterium]MDP2346249.1 dienelactone hydrolase family protein [Gammaproteobacteria bacterium]